MAIDQKISPDRSISAYTLPRNQFLSLSLSLSLTHSLTHSLVRNRFQQKANNPKPRKIPVPPAIKGYSTNCARPREQPSLVKSELARWLIRRNREESNRRAGPVSRDETNDNVFQPCGPLMKTLR